MSETVDIKQLQQTIDEAIRQGQELMEERRREEALDSDDGISIVGNGK